jgi:geranylgeranyl reductase family protein
VERFDVLVVGAGPAGSATAIRLARGGAKVLLADRARFPRDKPCGGGLTGRALKQAPCDVTPVVERVVHTFQLRLHFKTSFTRSSAEPLILMTQRRRLDAYLAEQAVAAGATFRDGSRVEQLELGEGGITASVGGTRVAADMLVGADGANGVVAKTAGLEAGIVRGVALEGNVPWSLLDADRFVTTAVIEFGAPPGGYGWLFPKGDHANLGVGGWDSEGPHLREHLARVARAYEIDPAAIADLRGHRLPMRRLGASTPARDRVLLVGDAAGLVDPLSGDGMYEAFASSRLASESIVNLLEGKATSLEPYNARVTNALALNAAASWGAKIALDRYPWLTFNVGRLPVVWGAVERMLSGDLKDPGSERGPARYALKVIERLARWAGDPGAAYRAEANTA